MRIIDEYLADVRRYLPEDIADDIVEELKANIMDRIEDMGGLTVENAYYVINDLGPPRKLASRYVVGRGRKRFVFELGISEDLYPYFIGIVLLIFIVMVMAYTIKILDYIYTTGYISGFKVSIMIVELVASIALATLLLYLIMSFISSNPEVMKALRDAFMGVFEHFKEKQIATKKREKKAVMREYRKTKVEMTSPWGYIMATIFAYILAYIIYVNGTHLPLNWLMMMLIYTMTLALVFSASINFIYFFYVLYYENRNYALDTLKSLTPLIFTPWLLLANIFTEDIQVVVVDPEKFESCSNILESLIVTPIPPEYIILAKLLTILILIAIVVGCVIVILKYVRTIPRPTKREAG